MPTAETAMGSILQPTMDSKKTRITINIRQIDNGFILIVNKDSPEGYQSVELSVASLPKLLTAIGTFLKEKKENK